MTPLLLALWLAASAGAAGPADDTARLDVRVVTPAAPLTSPAKVVVSGASSGQPRSTLVPPTGIVDIPGLPPDVYDVTVEMAGFAAARGQVRLTARDVVRLAVSLAPSGRAASTIVETGRTRDGEGQTFDRAWLDDLPGGDDVWRLLETAAPFVIADRMDNGGLGAGRSALVGSRGASWTGTTVSFDGAAIGLAGRTGRLPISIDPQPLEAVVLTSGLAPVEIGTPGVALSLVPRRPGRTAGGSVYAHFTSPAMVSVNALSDAPSVERLSHWWNVGGDISAPLGERAGLVAAGTLSDANYVERGRPGDLSAGSGSFFGHVVLQRGGRDQVRVLGSVQGVSSPFDDRRQFADRLVDERGTFWQTQLTWERAPERGGRYRVSGGVQGWRFEPQVTTAAGGLVDRVTDGVVPPPAASTHAALWQVGGELEGPTWFVSGSTHAVRAGVTVLGESATSEILALPAVAESVNGLAARVWLPVSPAGDSNRSRSQTAVYVADRMTLGANLTADVGIRLDAAAGRAEDAANSVSWASWSPRASFRWQRKHVGVFGGAGRYASPLPLPWLAFGDPGETVFNVHRWNDVNANLRVDPGETGVLIARSGRGASVAGIDPDLEGPTTSEWTIGAEYRASRMTLRGALIWRRESSLVASLNTGVPASSYRVIYVPDQGADWDHPDDDRPLAVYERLPSSFGRDAFLLTNPEGARVKHEGIEFTWEWNEPRWRMVLGATTYRSYGLGGSVGYRALENDPGVMGERYELPGAAAMPAGRLFFDRAYVGKWSGSYRAAGDVLVSGTVRYQDGQPFSRLVVVPDLSTGPEAVEAYQTGLTRFTYTGTVDLRVEKGFPIGERRAVFRLDVFNIANFSNEVDEDVVTGPAFRRSTAVQPPLTIRLGLRLTF